MRGRTLCAALFGSALVLGCAKEGSVPTVPVYPVSGKVMLHGAPLADASVSFAPLGEGQRTAVGRTNAQGEFTLTTYEYGDGAAAGEYAVVITKSVSPATPSGEADHSPDPYASGAADHDASGEGTAEGVSMVPPQYGRASETPLRQTVGQGDNNFVLNVE